MLAQRWGWIRLAQGNIQTANSCKSLRNRPPLPCSAAALLCFCSALLQSFKRSCFLELKTITYCQVLQITALLTSSSEVLFYIFQSRLFSMSQVLCRMCRKQYLQVFQFRLLSPDQNPHTIFSPVVVIDKSLHWKSTFILLSCSSMTNRHIYS